MPTQKRNDARRRSERNLVGTGTHSRTGARGGVPGGRVARRSARNMSADLSGLVRNEMQLAQTEITGKLKHAGAGVGAFGGARRDWHCTALRCWEWAVASVKTDVAEIKESIKQ